LHRRSFGTRQTPRKQFCYLWQRLYAPGEVSTRSIVVSGMYLQNPNRLSSQRCRRVGSADNISPAGHLTRSAAGLTQPLIRYLSRPTCRLARSPQPPDIHSDVESLYSRLRGRQYSIRVIKTESRLARHHSADVVLSWRPKDVCFHLTRAIARM
jgi:hypothetical protein